MLAWLLRPGETHGFGDAFLRKLLECLRGKKGAASEIAKLVSPGACFAKSDVGVEREHDHVDVAVFFEREPKLLLAIENKIGERLPEHREQLRGYVKVLAGEYEPKGYRIQGVLLTASPEGDPEDDDYPYLSWHEVRGLVDSVRNENEFVSEEVKTFIHQYLEIVDRNVLGAGPAADSFDELVKCHRPVLQRLLPGWEPGTVPPDWGVPERCVRALDSLLREFRHQPRALREAVKGLLQGKRFKTELDKAPGRPVYWLSFWDDAWEKIAEKLDLDELGWSLTITHRSVTAHLSVGPVTGKKRKRVDRVFRLIGKIAVVDEASGRFPLKFEGPHGYFYEHDLLTRCDFVEASSEEIRKRTLDAVERFLESPDYKRIENYFKVLAFRP